MTPQDFTKGTILSQALALHHAAIARSGSFELDPKTACWLATKESYRGLLYEADPRDSRIRFDGTSWRLLGLPVRVTSWDPPGTPELQLVMEPMLVARR